LSLLCKYERLIDIFSKKIIYIYIAGFLGKKTDL
jgi:hypothetical protein